MKATEAALKPYPAYKSSGVAWMGALPDHWRQLPGRSCFREKHLANVGMVESTVLSLSYGQIVVKPVEKLHGLVPESFETYQIIEPHDIVCRPTDLQNDWNSLRFGLSQHRGIITSAYMALRTEENLSSEFGYLLLHAYDLKKIFYGLGSGLRQNLDWRDFKYLPCVVPPSAEQSAIVRYLAYIERKIHRFIRAKQRLIKLLDEQRQVIIHQAVTGQIDVRTNKPYPAYKNSGVQWLGQVPDHWNLLPNGSLMRRRKVLVGERHTEYQLLSLTKEGVIVRDVESGKGKFSADMGTCQQVRAGNLVFCLFDVPETPRTVGLSRHDGMITGAYTLFECADPILSEFLELFYRAMDDRKLLSPLYSGLRNTIPPTRLLRTKTPVPPPDEQGAIVGHLEDIMMSVDKAIGRAKCEIDFAREYRVRLITDVVTGKLDVREAAANLPDATEEREPIANEDLLADENEANETVEEETVLEEVEP